MKISLFLCLILSPSLVFACTKITQANFDDASYYSSTAGLEGNALKSELNAIIRGHTVYSYTPCVWEILKEADEDPNNTNNVIGVYTRRSIPKADRDQGGNTPDYWNREHSWPKSHGFSSKNQHAYTDTHHLYASDKSVNADRANLDFGEGSSQHYECSGCMWGNGVWEPPEVMKGDIARSMLYMDTRYEGADNTGVSDLELVDRTTSVGENALGTLCTLIDWHIADAVSAEEMARNDVIYSWQGNRNPFVDHPEFALSIWGSQCGIVVQAPSEKDEEVPLPFWALIALFFSLGTIASKFKRK